MSDKKTITVVTEDDKVVSVNVVKDEPKVESTWDIAMGSLKDAYDTAKDSLNDAIKTAIK